MSEVKRGYISFETAQRIACKMCEGGCIDTRECEVRDKLLAGIPAANVREVILCKDCKFNTGPNKCLYPDSIIKIPSDDDFCSYGQRRAE